ncbi:MAG: DUF1588 domain-containing protein [Rubripirellula sp.]
MKRLCTLLVFLASFALSGVTHASEQLLRTHCFGCHNVEKSEGDFKINALGLRPTALTIEIWTTALDLVSAGEMPPAQESELDKDSELKEADRKQLVDYFAKQVAAFNSQATRSPMRRLNNREFAASVRDTLLLEKLPPNFDSGDLLADDRHEGFDNSAATLGMSRYHMEKYAASLRKVIDATILSGDQPTRKKVRIPAKRIIDKPLIGNTGDINKSLNWETEVDGRECVSFGDPQVGKRFRGFDSVSLTGNYAITVRAAGVDRMRYDTSGSGFYSGDMIQLLVRLGAHDHVFELPDEELAEIALHEWLAEGSELSLHHPTDAHRMLHNGGFKHQAILEGEYLEKNDPEKWKRLFEERYQQMTGGKPSTKHDRDPSESKYWRYLWRGARPAIYSVEIDGPIFESWPPKRQVALIGANPEIQNARDILEPIARRAWKRNLKPGELDSIVAFVERSAESMGTIDAFKEGILAIMLSPHFLMVNDNSLAPNDALAIRVSYFLKGTLPSQSLREEVARGGYGSHEEILLKLLNENAQGEMDVFLGEFPYSWLKLADINFMAPDPKRYLFYDRKQLGEDMKNEALAFFRHVVTQNRPVTELLSADYSFVNADLAQIYGLEDVPMDSRLRKYTFTDGRRGGLLGMGAFLTSTADTLTTSPIHRAVYVMETLMGIHPSPPPPDINTAEPDVRNAKTIKEVLAAHASDQTCATCHQTIDPWGYAFENFDPSGAWRDHYMAGAKRIPIDATSSFRNGTRYTNISDFRKLVLSDANRDRFVRCFISKRLTYANGTESDVAAVIDSPLFRQY